MRVKLHRRELMDLLRHIKLIRPQCRKSPNPSFPPSSRASPLVEKFPLPLCECRKTITKATLGFSGPPLDNTAYTLYTIIMDYTVVFYQDETGDSQPLSYLGGLNRKHEAKAKKWLALLQEYGPNLPRPYADVLEGNIRELRPAIEHHQHRFLYVIHGKTILVTNAFLKKTQAVPKSEIERARRLYSDWLKRKEG